MHVPGFPNPLKLNQSWWCGYGPFDAPTIVVCAVIENGGHGGTAAAPAALQVFEQYFHTTRPDHDRTWRPTDGDRSRRLQGARAPAAPRGRRRSGSSASSAGSTGC